MEQQRYTVYLFLLGPYGGPQTNVTAMIFHSFPQRTHFCSLGGHIVLTRLQVFTILTLKALGVT